MNIAPDKITHLKWGCAAAVATLGALLTAIHLSGPAALAGAGTLFAWALERYQAVRREGQAEDSDMIATALPFWMMALGWQAQRWLA